MPDTLSYADAVRLLGGENSRFVTWFDKLTGWSLLGASVGGMPGALSIFDAKAEFVRLGHELVRNVSDQRSGLSRYDRTQRLEAAHAVIAVTSFFEALNDADLPFDAAQMAMDKREQLALASAGPVADAIVDAFFGTAAPLPGPHVPYPALRAALATYYDGLAARVLRFVEGLAVWDQANHHQRSRISVALSQLPDVAVRRHGDLLTRLAEDFFEVNFWLGLQEHEATREQLGAISVGLEEMRRTLAAMSTGRAPTHRRAGLAAAYASDLRQPVVSSGDVPAGLRMPTLGEAYVPPLCRIAELSAGARPSDESWWREHPLREDLWQSLVVHLTTPGATTAPLLVLGQPGSGKSLLTRILAAQLPAADFLVIRVVLREVYAAGDLQDQIEQAVRTATGERLTWPDLVRSADDAMPVVLLDGFDELLQATGASQTDYLRRVAVFQRREADQGRSVAVLVTTRTSVADRAQPPPGAVAVLLEPFDTTRIRTWVATWNRVNADAFRASGTGRLDPDVVQAHRELAEQPLLLLMLALYDADGHDLGSTGALGRGELYERLLKRFAHREVLKQSSGLSDRDLARATEEELRRLSVVAFSMFNRGVQWVSEDDLEADLVALPFLGRRAPTIRQDERASLSTAEIVLGRFFFVHRSTAVREHGPSHTYEFLHATFGEFLIARTVTLVLRDLVMREAATLLDDAPVDDDRLYALLSFAVLSNRAPVVTFVVEALMAWPEDQQAEAVTLLLRLFRVTSEPRPSGRYESYRPRRLHLPERCAVYAANLLLLALCVRDLPCGDVFPSSTEPVQSWRRQALQWRAHLDDAAYLGLLTLVHPQRMWQQGRAQLKLSLRPGDDQGPLEPDPRWNFLGRRDITVSTDGEHVYFPNVDLGLWRRSVHFECDPRGETVLHALEPAIRLSSSEGRFDTFDYFLSFPDGDRSEARLVLDAALLPLQPTPRAERERVYRRLLAGVEPLAATPGGQSLAAFLLDRLASDTELSPAFVADVLQQLDELDLTVGQAAPAVRCVLAFLGQDDQVDTRWVALVGGLLARSRGGAAGRGKPLEWLDESTCELVVRMYELELHREPISAAEAQLFSFRYGARRPDLVQRLRLLADEPSASPD
ncbi:NACHT domain-containing protein [Micromonospora foliorum]|uniref:NACHT domain-containing protein n=1 Tax=Micromonospora foliorum TaxID=2911210 RepID=UPI001EE92582|nr:AAA family ATPase [Micromonospora foliorum]MCG5439606.1 AAA family ATPase [Micromonospora foliorum]